MNAILAAAVIFVVFAIGDMISAKTRAIVSMLLVASVVFLAGFWTGIFPTTMFADSTLLSMAGLLVTMLLVHLGTTIKLRDFGAQWRTVIIAAVACIAISAAVFFLGQLIVDRGFALVGRSHSVRRRGGHADHAGYGQQGKPPQSGGVRHAGHVRPGLRGLPRGLPVPQERGQAHQGADRRR